MQSFKEFRFNCETRTLISWRGNINPTEFSLREFSEVRNGLVAESKRFYSNFGGKTFYSLV